MSFKEVLLSVPDQYPTLCEQTIGKGNHDTVNIKKCFFGTMV